MSQTKAQLNTSAILDVPIHNYNQDFTFIVNSEEFHTTKIISDLLSPKISQIHYIDPTFDSYVITTTNRGKFTNILELVNFSEKNIPEDEFPFFTEILSKLENTRITITLPMRQEEITIKNVISLIKTHEKNPYFYSKYLKEEIEFISQHFSELDKEDEKELNDMNVETLTTILQHDKLQLRDENQLLNILNYLYEHDKKYSELYKYVYYSNVTEESICEFIDIFDIEYLDEDIWRQIADRLKRKVEMKTDKINERRYLKQEINQRYTKEIKCNHDDKFDGIINYLIKESNNNIKNMISITSSSIYDDDQRFTPYNTCLYEEKDKNVRYVSKSESNQWVCFDFKDHKIIPTN